MIAHRAAFARRGAATPVREKFADRWRRSWNHALARYYRCQPGWALSPRAGAIGIALVWGTFLIGTALGVALYPQATAVQCDRFTCYYPLGTTWTIYSMWTNALAMALCIGPLIILLILIPAALIIRWRRGRPLMAPAGATIANSWHNGVIDLLTILPMAGGDLIRIRFLSQLWRLWQQRALVAMGIGVLAAVVVSQHVLFPIFWWLGPWRQWAVQLVLVLLWSAVAVSALIAWTAFATLNEVTSSVQAALVSWAWIGQGMFAAMLFAPILLLGQIWAALDMFPLQYHDRNVLYTVLGPLALLALALAFAVLNYLLAQGIFRLRLRVTGAVRP